MVGTPTDLTPFQEVNDRLAVGQSASHTRSDVYKESIWPVELTGVTKATLIWPDYGGEQVEHIVSRRSLTEQWVRRIQQSDGWLLMIRLAKMDALEDVLVRPRAIGSMQSRQGSPDAAHTAPEDEHSTGSTSPANATRVPSSTPLTSQADLVELLQAMLFVRERAIDVRLEGPPLVVTLSCLDEIGDAQVEGGPEPHEILRRRLPLLSQFLDANWHSDALEIVGLSALGRPLNDEISDEEFMDNGPDQQGWCVRADGTRSEDLTVPVSTLIRKTFKE
jgi:hypothetical protein